MQSEGRHRVDWEANSEAFSMMPSQEPQPSNEGDMSHIDEDGSDDDHEGLGDRTYSVPNRSHTAENLAAKGWFDGIGRSATRIHEPGEEENKIFLRSATSIKLNVDMTSEQPRGGPGMGNKQTSKHRSASSEAVVRTSGDGIAGPH